jgi:glycolate oxidase FAD binding subunit
MDSEPFLIDGVPLNEVVRPRDPSEVGALVRRAASAGVGLFPLGGRTMIHVGQPPARGGVGIDLSELDRVIDYPARDMTITVEAGIILQHLQELLRTERQRLPIDIPFSDRATLGGSIAINLSGPRRLGYGTFRDYVIGIRFIDDQGNEVQGGGRVVKNVAGYDLCKLHTGAWGSLGIITQVTLKLKPIPEQHAAVSFTCPYEELGATLDRLHHSETRPTYVEAMSDGDDVRLEVGFEENGAAVAWQVEQLQREMVGRICQVFHGDEAERRLQDMWERVHAVGGWTWKANLRPSAVAPFVQNFPKNRFRWQAQALSGIVWGRATSAAELDQVQSDLNDLRRYAEAAQGSVVVWRCPAAWKPALQVWGSSRSDWELMRAIKRHLDPNGLFNPGRFVTT